MRSSPSWFASVVTRMVVLYSLLTAALIALFGWLSYQGNRDFLLQTEEAAMRHAAESVRLKFQSVVSDLVRDAVQISRSPTLREFVKYEQTPEGAKWKGIVEDAFRAVLEGKSSYFQVRLIGIGEGGAELVRLDNRDGFIVATPEERLQRKGDRDYFREALRTPGGAVYLSVIDLNRDFGEVTEPHLPTLRALKLVENAVGTLHSFLVINLDMRPLLEEASRLAGADARLILAREDGGYILHPDSTRMFAWELGGNANFANDFGPLELASSDETRWRLHEQGDEFVMVTRFPIAGGESRELVAAITRPADSLIAGLREARNAALRYTTLAALGGVLLVTLLARLLARRLRRLTHAVAEYETGEGMKNLPSPGRDEVGVLASRFQELDARVADSLARMAAAVKSREDFLAVMSHEVRTPMNAVIGLVRALERNAPPAHQAPILKSLGTASRNLMALLDDALDFSKLRAGRMELANAPFFIREVLGDVAMTHRPIAERKGVALDLEVAESVPESVMGDAVRLGQVLHNLTSNAVKFTAAGRVLIAVRMNEEKLEFAVSDSGIGIPEEMISRVFEPFDQAGADVAARFGGTGLGLTITRELVRMMGGELGVRSKLGEGSTFSFSLNLEAAAVPTKEAFQTRPSLAGKRVLYVEDVASNREVMTLIFEGAGADLVMAETGTEALEKLSGSAFDVILLDLQLPDTTGVALAPRLRAISSAPIIAVTAQATPAAREECAGADIRAMVTKPIDPEQLWREIAAVLGGISFARIEDVFGTDPDKMRSVTRLIAEEFAGHERALREAIAGADWEGIRKTKHKMHTAIVQLGLGELQESLRRLAEGDRGEAENCMKLVSEARAGIEARL